MADRGYGSVTHLTFVQALGVIPIMHLQLNNTFWDWPIGAQWQEKTKLFSQTFPLSRSLQSHLSLFVRKYVNDAKSTNFCQMLFLAPPSDTLVEMIFIHAPGAAAQKYKSRNMTRLRS